MLLVTSAAIGLGRNLVAKNVRKKASILSSEVYKHQIQMSFALHSITENETSTKWSQIGKAAFGGKIHLKNGLPIIDVPLPSRRENCQFILRPMSDTIGSLTEALVTEDSGIEVVTFYTADGQRISKSTRIQHLLTFTEFFLRINDAYYKFELDSQFDVMTSDKIKMLGDIQSKISSLYTVLNVDDYKNRRENSLLVSIENVERELRPLLIVRRTIENECEIYAHRVFWSGFLAICYQVGVFARLTWWEYSWDIMEPITYFSTFSSVVIALGYYVVTKQNFEYSSAHSRILGKDFYRRAQKYSFDANRFNELQALRCELYTDLRRLRDPLLQNLPDERLVLIEQQQKAPDIATK